VGTLTLDSASLDNRRGATINAADTTITTRGNLNNAGSIQGTTLNIDATDLNNSGWIQGTNALALNAANLDNAGPTAVIIGNGTLDILISNALNNRDGATLYSLGDLNLGASTRRDDDGHLTDSMERFTNTSGWVQAGGELRLAARQITNTRRLLDVQWGAERSGAYVGGNPRYTSYYATEYVTGATTPAAQLLSDSHMWLKGDILNEYSHIAAGGDLNHNPQQLTQTARALMEKKSDRGEEDNLQWVKVGRRCKRKIRRCIRWEDVFDWRNIPIPYNQEETYAIGSVNATLTANERQLGKAVNINNQTVSSTNGSAVTLDSRAVTAGGGAADTPLALPVSGLFQYRPGPGHPYLIETDPRFANFGQFMSSNYMLARLKFDPQQIQKRLGDAQVEQKRISDQILAQTGHRYLEGYTNADSEFLALMESGLEAAGDLHLRPGIALTAAQLDALGKNIVWLVEQSVDLPDGGSERVLVPVVYLTRRNSFELKPNGALIAAADLDLHATRTTVNSGTLRGQEHLRLAAADILNRQGRIVSDGVTELLADNDLVNQSGTVQGRQLTLAAGRDLRNERLTEGVQLGVTATTRIFDVASLSASDAATPGVQIQAGRDVVMAAGNVSSASDTRIVAGRKLSIDTVAAREQIASGPSQRGQQRQLASTLESAGHLNLVAANDATLTAAHVVAGQDLSLVAGGNIALKATKDHTSSAFDNGESTRNRYYDEHAKGSQLVAGGKLQMAAVELPCEPFVNAGRVANPGHGVVFPWIAKLSNKANRLGNLKSYLEQSITPGQHISVRGFSQWMDNGGLFVAMRTCGPRTSGFIPQPGRAYLIEFIWEGDTCRQVLYDATSPDSPELLSESDANV
jgi:adhesin HecA-like repeat protein